MQAKQLWQAALGDLQQRLTKSFYDQFLKPTAIVDYADDVATIAAANPIAVSTLQKRHSEEIERVLSDIAGRRITVKFTTHGAARKSALGERDEEPEENGRQPRQSGDRSRRSAPSEDREPESPVDDSTQLGLAPTPTHGLNPRYVYEHYIVGSSNRFAHAASLAVAERPGGQYNPFFIHGGVGLGKTHLLHAIGHRALEHHPRLNILYISSEKFTNDMINALRGNRMDEFRSRYRTIDILMIDDIQFIAGKEGTQEEFFHTFNALYQSGKQVVLSSDKPPKAIAALEDRLRSRFEGGLIADVQYPDYEMRTAILRSKADELNTSLPDDVIEYVAHKDQTNIRELEGALNKIIAYAKITGREATLHLAMEAIADAAIGQRRSNLSGREIVVLVAKHFDVSVDDLRGRGRAKEIVAPRQVAMYLIREETGSSLLEIGQELGGRDHTTVMHGINKIGEQLQTDTALRANLMAIREALFAENR
jgi:chromosomal replication initiator protein